MQTPRCWQPALEAALREQALSLVTVIARRLSSPQQVLAVVEQQEPVFWTDTAFAAGFPSLALLFFSLSASTHDASWLEVAHTYLCLAATATRQQPLSVPGLARGTSGFVAVLACSEAQTRYQLLRQQLEQKLAHQLLHTIWWKPVEQAEVFHYDAIAGAAGMVGALCCAPVSEPLLRKALLLLLHHLVHFVESATSPDCHEWSIPPSLLEGHRQGTSTTPLLNCGLAHGLPGPLASLSIALLSGYQIPGQVEAVHRLASWLVEHHLETPWGMDWPDTIPLGLSLSAVRHLAPARSGWCYGAPGVLRALWLAGQALHDPWLQAQALQGVQSLLRRPAQSRHLDPLTLCHGMAGLLLICLHFLHETELPALRASIPMYVQQIIAQFQPDLPFGFHAPFKPGTVVDSVGLLIGVAGTLLALLAACTDEEPRWDRALLLS